MLEFCREFQDPKSPSARENLGNRRKKNHLFLGVKGCGNWLKFDPIGARSCTFDRIFLPVRRLYPKNFKSKMPASIAKGREIFQIFDI